MASKTKNVVVNGKEVSIKCNVPLEYINAGNSINPSKDAGKGVFKDYTPASLRASCARLDKTLHLISSEKKLDGDKVVTIYKKKAN